MVAEVNDSGEVTVEGEFVGRLEGFRFKQDKGAGGQEAKTLAQASLQALAPHFHLKADRFYNAPDTEIDFTEQGGLMWGKEAVGKLTASADPLKPQVVAFVDDEAGPDVAQKVQRRLQHFIDRKVATLFEPLLNIQRDETLNGLARGFGFRMVENFGIIPRGDVADEVKALDQDARGALRKHGIRFGQFTIFMPLLLKPAPTRLRLVLWSLANGLEEFPEAPPPGLVTVPAASAGAAQPGFHSMSGYRAAGERAIRIDMLERLADMLRAEDSRGGFEAKADMLSITGMTLEQFADLMQGLGYRAERGEREKVKAVDTAMAEPASLEAAAPDPADVVAADLPDEGVAPIAAEPSDAAEVEAEIPAQSEGEMAPGTAPDAPEPDAAEPAEIAPAEAEPRAAGTDAAPEIEVFYTFSWAPKPRGNRPQPGGKPRGKGKPPKGKPRRESGKPPEKGAKTYSARPQKKDRIDPDNPFAAALMGLKDKT